MCQDAFCALGGTETERLGCAELRKLAKFTGHKETQENPLKPRQINGVTLEVVFLGELTRAGHVVIEFQLGWCCALPVILQCHVG